MRNHGMWSQYILGMPTCQRKQLSLLRCLFLYYWSCCAREKWVLPTLIGFHSISLDYVNSCAFSSNLTQRQLSLAVLYCFTKWSHLPIVFFFSLYSGYIHKYLHTQVTSSCYIGSGTQTLMPQWIKLIFMVAQMFGDRGLPVPDWWMLQEEEEIDWVATVVAFEQLPQQQSGDFGGMLSEVWH